MIRSKSLVFISLLLMPPLWSQIRPGGGERIPKLATVATLGTGYTGQFAYVTDGTGANDCTVGGGATKTLCEYNGATWGAVGVGVGGSGTVTSVSFPTIPSWLTASVANATTTPAISVTLTAAQTSHQVIGTCGSGTTFAPCALVGADIPAINLAASGNGGVTGTLASGNFGPLTGDVPTSGYAATVVALNGTTLSVLATGLLKNTTGTGVPSIGVAGTDFVGGQANISSAGRIPYISAAGILNQDSSLLWDSTNHRGTFGSGYAATVNAPFQVQVDGSGNGFVVSNMSGDFTQFISGGVAKGMKSTGGPAFSIRSNTGVAIGDASATCTAASGICIGNLLSGTSNTDVILGYDNSGTFTGTHTSSGFVRQRVLAGQSQGSNKLWEIDNNTGTAQTFVDSSFGFNAPTYLTTSNCSSSASPAVCSAAAAGSVVVAAAATTVVVNTTAVTANSQIFVMYDSSLGTKLSVTCNATEPALYGVTARTAATSFTITATSPVTNPACFSYFIVN